MAKASHSNKGIRRECTQTIEKAEKNTARGNISQQSLYENFLKVFNGFTGFNNDLFLYIRSTDRPENNKMTKRTVLEGLKPARENQNKRKPVIPIPAEELSANISTSDFSLFRNIREAIAYPGHIMKIKYKNAATVSTSKIYCPDVYVK